MLSGKYDKKYCICSDCFANHYNHCRVLEECVEHCPFYKSVIDFHNLYKATDSRYLEIYREVSKKSGCSGFGVKRNAINRYLTKLTEEIENEN